MTKSLTEKWKDGELPIGHYYVKRKNGMVFIDNTILQFDEMPITKLAWSDKTEEVLAPVPSYDEYKELVKKVELLEFDNDVLNSVADQQDDKLIAMDKKMAEMRKQIMQANKCIKHCSAHPCCEKYLKKWGVK